MNDILLGAHVSIAGGFARAVERAEKLNCTAIQVFTKNQVRWDAPALKDDEIEEFNLRLSASGIRIVVGHSSYLINLASDDKTIAKKSIDALFLELDRCRKLGIPYYVIHPGAHKGAGKEKGIINIVYRLKEAVKEYGDSVTICVETMAGQGTTIGERFEDIASIIDGVGDEIGVCIDTCHIFAAGYDIRTEEAYNNTFSQFDRIIGMDFLKVLHLNDSKADLGAHVDRHIHIGKGRIGLKAFGFLMNDSRFAGIPKIIETPKDSNYEYYDRQNLETLRSLLS